MNDQPPEQLKSEQSMKDDILKVLESGQVTMRPKWHFVIQTLAAVIGGIFLTLTAIYLASFIVYMLRESGVWFTPGFGLQGVRVFLTSLPWILIVVATIFIIFLEILVRRYSFAYGRPFVYSALGIMAVVLVGGVAIGYTSFHQHFFEQSQKGQALFGQPLYDRYMHGPDNVTVGAIIEINDRGYKISATRDEIFLVVVTPQTQIPPGKALRQGDVIVVLGRRDHGTIQAQGIQKPDHIPPPHGRRSESHL